MKSLLLTGAMTLAAAAAFAQSAAPPAQPPAKPVEVGGEDYRGGLRLQAGWRRRRGSNLRANHRPPGRRQLCVVFARQGRAELENAATVREDDGARGSDQGAQ
jgi:hypothetical protein